MIRLSISLLGSFEVHLDEENITPSFRTKKERALFAYLAAEANKPHAREVVAELFWPDRPEGYARTNLRQALTGIRRALGSQNTTPNYLKISDDFIQLLANNTVSIDVVEFDRLISFTSAHKHTDIHACETCAGKLEIAVESYQGEFLEEFLLADSFEFQEWIIFQREHHFRQLLTALKNLIEYYARKRDFKTAQKYAWRQVQVAPLEETAHQQLMLMLAMDGRRSAALEQYQNCRTILAKELGIDPDLETTALYEKIKAGLVVDTQQPIVREALTNLPAQFATFVGRNDELAWFDDCMPNRICRLMTITGMAGVGKTRLAIQVGRRFLNNFSDGVWFVPLDAIYSSDLLAPAILNALGVELQANHPAKTLMETLRPLKALLIMDNFENLTDGTELLLEILQQAPNIKILVTSQHRLISQAAFLLELRGLPYPAKDERENLLEYAAIELFLARASRANPEVNLSSDDIASVIDICSIVDGLPLGIELAAANLRHFSCRQIANELRQKTDILSTTMIDLPERHRSLRAAFDQSWVLLSLAEKDAYRRLSVFQGEFSLDLASATTGASLSTITSLADRSLIQMSASGRYIIQPLLKQYASEKLAEYMRSEKKQTISDKDDPLSITRDPITKLPNRLLFRDLLQHSIARSRRRSQQVMLLLLEFSPTEKTLAATQPAVLIEFAGLLQKSIRESDAVARLDEEHFAIILDDVNNPDAGKIVAQKVLNNLHDKSDAPFHAKPYNTHIGISVFPDHGEEVMSLMRCANQAMLTARESQARFLQFEPAMFESDDPSQ